MKFQVDMAYAGVPEAIINAMKRAIESVHPDTVIPENIRLDGNTLHAGEYEFGLEGGLYVFGMGKASYHMAKALYRVLGDRIDGGIVNSIKEERIGNMEIRKASHPYPDEKTVESTEYAVDMAKSLGERDTAIVLISGGGSSMFCMPAEGISCEDVSDLSGALMSRGADIWELNTVRRSLSMVKGGGFARHLRPARIVSLIISDVPDNDLASIASGPTVAVNGGDAENVLRKYGLWDELPDRIKRAMGSGKQRESADLNLIIADNRRAVNHASATLTAWGISHQVFNGMKGDVQAIAEDIAGMKMPFVMGGESTAEVRGNGRGGRNQELVLRALLSGFKGTIAAIGTDGIDGNSPYAGAISDNYALSRAKSMGLDPEEFLRNSDSSSFFEKVGGTIETGYTGTNVADIVIGVNEGIRSKIS